MAKEFKNTLKSVKELTKITEKQLSRLQKVKSALSTFVTLDFTYEVHFQQDNPNIRAIKGTGKTLSEALYRANRLNKKINKREGSRAQVFACFDNLRIALAPQDAAAIIVCETGSKPRPLQFCLDSRLGEIPKNAVVFGKKEKLPGWYAE